MATTDYATLLQKLLDDARPKRPPVSGGPQAQLTGTPRVQASMSPADFANSVGVNWDEFSKPGGYLDKFFSGQAAIQNPDGSNASIEQVMNSLRGQGRDFQPNPFLALPEQWEGIYDRTRQTVGSQYDALAKQLAGNQADFASRGQQYLGDLTKNFDQASQDVADSQNPMMDQIAKMAQASGLAQTLQGAPTQQAADNMARLGKINETNKANSLSTFGQRTNIISDLLGQRAATAATEGQGMQDTLTRMFQQRWGMEDPNTLFAQHKQQQTMLEMAKLEQQAALQEALMASSGGGGGGGGGRRRGGGSRGTANAAGGPGEAAEPYDIYSQAFADNPTAEGYGIAAALERQLQGSNQVGRKSNHRKAVAI